jgi:hypothetical protein
LGAKGMAALSDKIAKGVTKLLPEEGAIMNFINANPKLVQIEYKKFIDNATKKLSSNVADEVKTEISTAGYNMGYDAVVGS